MSFLGHVLILVGGLAAFVWVPMRWRRPSPPTSSAVHGIPCNFKSRRVSRSGKVDVTVTLPCDPRFEFSLWPERATDRIAKVFGLVREFQTRDERFDRAVYVGADERGVDDWLAQDSTARQLIMDLLTQKPEENTQVTALSASGGAFKLVARCKPAFFSSAPGDLDVTVAGACVPSMKQCVDRLQAFAAKTADPEAFRDRYGVGIRVVKSLTAGVLIVPVVIYFLDAIQRPPVRLSAESAFTDTAVIETVAVAVALLAIGGFALLRGSVRLHTVLVPLLLCGALGLSFGAVALVDELNEQWDTSKPQPHAAQVVGRYMTHNRNSTSHYLTLADSDGNTVKLDVNENVYDSVRQGDEVTLWERAGYLKSLWVSDLTQGPPAEADRADPGIPATP